MNRDLRVHPKQLFSVCDIDLCIILLEYCHIFNLFFLYILEVVTIIEGT